jgi:hypothetical protein
MPLKAPIAQSCALPGKAPGFAISVFTSLYGQKLNRRWGLISRLPVTST